MKNLLVVILAFLLFVPVLNAQASKEYETIVAGVTVANSSKTLAYVSGLVGGDLKPTTDSVSFKLVAQGEIDLDRFVVTKGVIHNGTFYAVADNDTTTLTIDNAAGVTTSVIVAAATASTNSIEGVEAIKISVEAGSSGNDPTDPNALYVYALRHYTVSVLKQK